MDLVYKNERRLFVIAVIISSIVWLAVIVGTLGIALIYVLFGVLFYLFAHAAFITHVKGTGVRVSETQFPDVHQRVLRSAQKIGLDKVPEAYVLRTDVFNALATRFLGRTYIILFSDVLDALDSQPGALDFYIGHELGHIHRRHVVWSAFLIPAMLLPLLGAGYRRAQEYTCDRYGAACCDNEADIRAALAAIAAGNTRWKTINTEAYLHQVATSNGFWMSFNELTNDYPWLTKRMATALADKRGMPIAHPRRHFGAWLLALVTPRVGVGGSGSLLFTVAMIGVLAAIAIPAYQDYTQRAIIGGGQVAVAPIKLAVEEYRKLNGAWPQSLVDLGYPEPTMNDESGRYLIGIYAEGAIGVDVGSDPSGNARYLVFQPIAEEGKEELTWTCSGENVPAKYLPPACR